MSASDYVRSERRALADLLIELGPDAPTLCEGWSTRDLATHLVIREGKPVAALGILGGPFRGLTSRAQEQLSSLPYSDLVGRIRTGPPRLSPFAIPGVEGLANLVEYAVHHEDVRRAQPHWTPRELSPGEADALWSRLRQAARLLMRSSPVGVALQRTDGAAEYALVKDAQPLVSLGGAALELVLRAYGRRECEVRIEGDEDAVRAFESAQFGF